MTIGTAREPRDLLEGALGARLTTLLEQEHRHAEQRPPARARAVDALLPAVASIAPGIDLGLPALALGMGEHLAHLGVAALAGDARHQPRKRLGVADPFARTGLIQPAEVDELHIKAAN